MKIQIEIEHFHDLIHKAQVQIALLKTLTSQPGEPNTTFSDELHKLATHLEKLTLRVRNVNEAWHIESDASSRFQRYFSISGALTL